MKVPFDITVATGGDKSKQFSSEGSRNVYFSIAETNNRKGAHDFPGLKLVSSGSGADRGDHVMSGVRYLINGTSLVSEISNGTRTTIGAIAGTDRATFADDGANLYLVANSTIYKYDGSTLSTVTQSVVTNPSSIDYINKQFIISGDGGLFATSDAGDGDTYKYSYSIGSH